MPPDASTRCEVEDDDLRVAAREGCDTGSRAAEAVDLAPLLGTEADELHERRRYQRKPRRTGAMDLATIAVVHDLLG
jgi:hypothetical protein